MPGEERNHRVADAARVLVLERVVRTREHENLGLRQPLRTRSCASPQPGQIEALSEPKTPSTAWLIRRASSRVKNHSCSDGRSTAKKLSASATIWSYPPDGATGGMVNDVGALDAEVAEHRQTIGGLLGDAERRRYARRASVAAPVVAHQAGV